jgi:hypothetical protein
VGGFPELHKTNTFVIGTLHFVGARFCCNMTKHFEVDHHLIRELLQDGQIELAYWPTEDQLVDIFNT